MEVGPPILAVIGNVETGRADAKREIRVVGATRMSVPMQRTGAEQPVVVMKSGKADGAKELRQSVSRLGQPERGGTHGCDKAVRLTDGGRMNSDVHVQFCEGLRVKFPGATHPVESRFFPSGVRPRILFPLVKPSTHHGRCDVDFLDVDCAAGDAPTPGIPHAPLRRVLL